MVRIAEEQKFLAELDSPGGGGGGSVKLDTLSSVDNHPSSPAPQQFIPQVNEEEERRRIAEQQKFLAELDSPGGAAAQAERQAPIEQGAMTDYGQIKPSFDQQSADQTNYGQMKPAGGVASGDQTQVSYLAGVLPAQSNANATVINPQVRNEPAAVAAPAPAVEVAEPQAKNKLLWLIPVAAVGVFLLIGIVGVLAYVFSGGPDPVKPANQAQSNSRVNSTNVQAADPTPAPIETPAGNTLADSPAGASNQSASSEPSTTSTSKSPVATTQKPVNETPKAQTRTQEPPTQQQQATKVEKPKTQQQPKATTQPKTGSKPRVDVDDIIP
jgi:flagellar basal body-associated protein FliL